MQKEITTDRTAPPKGWRFLKHGEKIKKGDKWYSDYDSAWLLATVTVGQVVLAGDSYARRVSYGDPNWDKPKYKLVTACVLTSAGC